MSMTVLIGLDPFTDVQTPKEEVTVASIEEQSEWESRKLWSLVAKGIREGDFELASREKSKIEVRPLQKIKKKPPPGTRC
jgi:oxysterol-binding protein-related protein 9/10/11